MNSAPEFSFIDYFLKKEVFSPYGKFVIRITFFHMLSFYNTSALKSLTITGMHEI